MTTRPIAGADGCKAGWVAAIRDTAGGMRVAVFAHIDDLAESLPDDAVIVVDMPIGLPERSAKGGRGPEQAARPMLGERQSSVFSIPSRAAVYAEPGPFTTEAERYAAHRRACAVALATSDPPRKISIQAFGIFDKIRQVDGLLQRRPDLRARLLESHPEAAFWRLNGARPAAQPKKIKGRINPAGMAERRDILARCGIGQPILSARPPAGAGDDDVLDACAMLLIAERVAAGAARPYPAEPAVDARGNAAAIWL